MKMTGSTLSIVLIVVGLVIGAGAGYYLAPREGDIETVTVEVAPLAGKTVRLGYITPRTDALELAVPHVQEMMAPDYNEFADKLGYDVDFEYLVDDATGQAAVHLEKVQGFKSIDTSVFIGGLYSSQAQSALSYVNDNDMLMWSSSATSPLLSMPDDNLYRMCPTDVISAPAIAAMLVSRDIEACVVIQRGDAWGDGIYNFVKQEYEAKGGVILERIRYAAESNEFSNYLQTVENILSDAIDTYGIEHLAVEIISFPESVVIVSQAEDYPIAYSVPWFGCDGLALVQQLTDDAPEQATHLGLFGTLAAPAESQKYSDLAEKYVSLVNQPYSFYYACDYDIGWIITNTILEAQSYEAMDIIQLQAPTAFNTFGASGWNRLNEYGDRFGSNYQIWSYDPDSVVVGLYDGVTDQVTWYIDWAW